MDISELEKKVEDEKIGYKDIFQQKEYMKTVMSSVINRFGDSIDCIAFEWLVYTVTGSAAWAAIIFALNHLPSVLVQPFAGVMVESMNKKWTMVVTDLVRGGIILLLIMLYTVERINPFILGTLTLMISTAEAFGLPAGMALMPKVIESKYYSFATSVSSVLSNIAQFIGYGLAGVIIGVGGVKMAMLIDACTFFLSAFFQALVNVNEEKTEKKVMTVKQYISELKEGFSYVKSKTVIFNFCILVVIVNAMVVPINSLETPMAVELFGIGSELLSVFGCTFILGMSLGAAILPYMMEKISVRCLVVLSGLITGISYGALVLGKFTYGLKMPSYLLCGGAALILGIAISWLSGVVNIQFMKNIEEKYIARAASIFNASACSAAPVVSMIVSVLALHLTVGVIFLSAAIGMIILFVGIGMSHMQIE